MDLKGLLKNLKSNDPSKSFVRKHPGLILYLLITLLVMALYLEQNTMFEGLENKIQDAMFAFRGEQKVGDQIVLLQIDDKTLDYLGWWPWSHHKLAQMIEALDYYQPGVIYLNFRIKNNVDDYIAGNSQLLAENIQQSKNIIMPFDVMIGNRTPTTHAAPDWLASSSIKPGVISRDEVVLASRLDLPEEIFGKAARYLGANINFFEKDNSLRYQPLITKFENRYYPSAELTLAAFYLGEDPKNIKYVPGQTIAVGNRSIPVNKTGEMLINFPGKAKLYSSYSVKELWEGKIPVEALDNKIVIVNLMATGHADQLKTPISASLSPGEKSAIVIDNIINGKFINSFKASSNLEMLVLLAIGLFCAFVVPRVSMIHRFTVLIVFLFVLINLNFILFSSFNTITSTLYPGFEILLFMGAAPMMKTKADEKRKADKEKATRIRLKESMIEEGEKTVKLDASKIQEREVPLSEDLQKPMPEKEPKKPVAAGDEHETAELSAFDHSVVNADEAVINTGSPETPSEEYEHRPATPDLELTPSPQQGQDKEKQKLGSSSEIEISFDESGHPSQFGRYKIIDILGQGAMGTVYRGLDPAIGRPVALKTIRFDKLANPDEIEELRERFMLEAKAAGNFSHPHIVTIYDVGQDRNIQYIAMEYLEGHTLDNMIKRKLDLNFRIVASIISQVCSALAYAHEQHVVHRDIKPANIMVLDGFRIKVMDFGIAHIESSNMTQTGVAMGTPNYISPEQLSGKEITKSSDIFSLGVVMYEMLTGTRPFEGENLNNLIVKILNHDPEPPSKLDSKVPLLLDHIVMKALEKDPLKRFQSAREMEKSLQAFVSSFASKPVRF
jgi:CHASE2 domain-containing sensor protein/tRNA A-37 threonylcarbamoyl transferase component Bud32